MIIRCIRSTAKAVSSFVLSLSLTAGVFTPPASAATCKNDGEWSPPSVGPIVTWTAPLCGKGRLAVQPYFTYSRTRGSFNEEGQYKSLTNKDRKWAWYEQLFVQFGVTDKLEIDGLGTYQQNIAHQSGLSAESAGFSDTYLNTRYCLIEDKDWMPCATALFQLKLPTGKYQKLDEGKNGTDFMAAEWGGGSYDHGYGIILSKHLKPFILHADFIYNIPILTKVDGVKVKYADYINWDAGFEYFLPKGFNLMLECNNFRQGDRKEDGQLIPATEYSYVNIGAGIGWSDCAIQTLLAYQRTLAGTNVSVNDSIVFTFVYTF